MWMNVSLSHTHTRTHTHTRVRTRVVRAVVLPSQTEGRLITCHCALPPHSPLQAYTEQAAA